MIIDPGLTPSGTVTLIWFPWGVNTVNIDPATQLSGIVIAIVWLICGGVYKAAGFIVVLVYCAWAYCGIGVAATAFIKVVLIIKLPSPVVAKTGLPLKRCKFITWILSCLLFISNWRDIQGWQQNIHGKAHKKQANCYNNNNDNKNNNNVISYHNNY